MWRYLDIPQDVFVIFKNEICFVLEWWSNGGKKGTYNVRRLRKDEITDDIKAGLVKIGFQLPSNL